MQNSEDMQIPQCSPLHPSRNRFFLFNIIVKQRLTENDVIRGPAVVPPPERMFVTFYLKKNALIDELGEGISISRKKFAFDFVLSSG